MSDFLYACAFVAIVLLPACVASTSLGNDNQNR
jgi:outer membrane biogenesis lipoprotein LolB